uniref:Uncharacterized protein n=1 Tax=Podarcis muralis TaxID=64176 RepID=A0A670K319_PODMU
MNFIGITSSPFSNPNGISSFSGKTSPPVIHCDVGPLSSFMQNAQRNSDSELLKNCEVGNVLFSVIKNI